MAGYNFADGNVTLASWMYGIDSWYTLYGLPSNYSNHYVMMDNYFDEAIQVLKTWDKGGHTTKEYAMALLYGMDNAGGPTGTSAYNIIKATTLKNEYESIISRYQISKTDMATFWDNELVPSSPSKKLPTSGC